MGKETTAPVDAIDAAHSLVEDALGAPKPTRPRAVTLKVAVHVLAYFGDEHLGQDGGDFANRLVRLITSADQTNRELLRSIYPEYVLAVTSVQQESWGLDWLRSIAREGVAP